MSRVLCLCDHGNNRSVTVAHHIKYLGHDVLSAGVLKNTSDTLALLCEWADHIITTDHGQRVPNGFEHKVQLWDIGPDVFPRPFNRQLLLRVRRLVEQHRDSLEPSLP